MCELKAAEKPLEFFTMMASELKDSHYWVRLEKFKLLSNQIRMEHYKLIYVWKSLNGHVLSLGLKLVYPKTFGSKGRARSLQKCAINWEGVKLFNCLPKEIRTFTGSKNSFKNILEQFFKPDTGPT